MTTLAEVEPTPDSSDLSDEPARPDQILAGLGITIALHLVLGGGSFALLSFIGRQSQGQYGGLWGLWILALIGVVQLVWMGPAIFWARQRQPDLAKGLVLGAALTVLANAACFGVLALG